MTKIIVIPVIGLTCACQVSTYQFRTDKRLSFESPKPRQVVSEPVNVTWSMRDFTATGLDGSNSTGSGEFAVFVDRQPMKVGQTLRDLGKDDPSCQNNGPCPSASFLADRGIYVTDKTSVSIPLLPQVGEGVGDEDHYLCVVLLDGNGKRRQESAWRLSFRRHRRFA